MLSKKDLFLYKHDKSTLRAVKNCPASTLVKLVGIWFDTPDLQPVNKASKLEDYSGLTRTELTDKVMADWVMYEVF